MTQTRAAALAATCWLELGSSSSSSASRQLVRKFIISISLLVVLIISLNNQVTNATSSAAIQADQVVGRNFGPHAPLSLAGAQFDASQFKSVHEAIRAHPDLRQFAQLCEAQGVREYAQMDKAALTIFAPIDKSLVELLARASKTRALNLIELAKHHMAHSLVVADDNTKYPLQFQSVALLSPLYLNQVPLPAASHANQQQQQLFVNNAKILATYLFQIDDNQYQALHLIDAPLEFAYVNRRTQLRSQTAASPPSGSGPSTTTLSAANAGMNPAGLVPLGSSTGSARFATVKRAVHLEDLLEARSSEVAEQTGAAVGEFYERFGGDLTVQQPQVDLYRTRVRTNQPAIVRDSLAYNQAKLANLFRYDSTSSSSRFLHGKLHHLNESSTSNSLNTYFLPVRSDELEQLLSAGSEAQKLLTLSTLQAHIIPGQVLFTRAMSLGQLHSSLFNYNHQGSQSISLSLAKTLPENLFAFNGTTSALQETTDSTLVSRRLLTTPLMVQASCVGTGSGCKQGLTSSEVLVANIPISNGVLHLIRRPLIAQSNSLLDYINDNEHQLTNIVHALGSQSAAGSAAGVGAIETGSGSGQTNQGLNRFRELLARADAQLSTFSADFLHANRTILAPTDEAFSRLRYDLRALIMGDESLIPAHWNPNYRQELLERLLKRHLVADQTLTSDTIATSGSASAINMNQQLVSFSRATQAAGLDEEESEHTGPEVSHFQVECDATRAQIVQRDLIGTNGVLHLIDRVLGEEQETIYSLLQSLVLRASNKLMAGETSGQQVSSPIGELSGLIESSLRSLAEQSVESGVGSAEQQLEKKTVQKAQNEPELAIIGKTIESYLNEMSPVKRQLLQASVNISFQLARLVSRAESRDDWNEQFKLNEKSFTYFVPNDLAWLRLQQLQPDLYKPLMLFLLDQQQQQPPQPQALLELQRQQPTAGEQLATSGGPKARGASESSHRLLQILERHLIGNKKLAARDLNQLGAIQTVGATLRLVDQTAALPQQQQLSADGQPMSAFAALHSIISGHSSVASSSVSADLLAAQSAAQQIKKALRYSSNQANLIQLHETSNGYLYLIDNVLLAEDDADHLVQTSSTPAISSTMSSLLGAHNSAILDFLHNLFTSSTSAVSSHLMLSLIGTLMMAILLLALVALLLVARRRRISKMNRHQQLESGLTSSSSASNSGSTSTTKSL